MDGSPHRVPRLTKFVIVNIVVGRSGTLRNNHLIWHVQSIYLWFGQGLGNSYSCSGGFVYIRVATHLTS